MTRDGMTIEEFVKWSLALPDPKRWELHDGRPTQRPASWWADGVAKGELLVQLHTALEADQAYEVLGFGPLLVTGPATAVEPHLLIVPRAGVDWDDVILRDPVTVVEVVRADGGAGYWLPRLQAYLALSTVQHVVAVHATARTALHLRRGADGAIAGRLLRGGVVALDPPGVALDLDQAWARLDRRRGRGDRA